VLITQLLAPDRPGLTVISGNPAAATDTAAKIERLLAEDDRHHGMRLTGGAL
jgi:hypothetical protein